MSVTSAGRGYLGLRGSAVPSRGRVNFPLDAFDEVPDCLFDHVGQCAVVSLRHGLQLIQQLRVDPSVLVERVS